MGFFVPLALAGISALGGALGNRKGGRQNQNSTKTFDRSGSRSFDRSFQPIISEDSRPLRGQLFNQFASELRRPGNLAQDQVNQFGVGQRARIGRQTNNFQQDLSRILRQQGLGSSASAALQRGSAEQFRGQQFGDLEEQLQRQRLQALEFDENQRLSRLDSGARFLSTIPVGERQTGTEETSERGTERMQGTGSSTGQQGGGWRGALSGALGVAGEGLQKGWNFGPNSGGGGFGGGFNGGYGSDRDFGIGGSTEVFRPIRENTDTLNFG